MDGARWYPEGFITDIRFAVRQFRRELGSVFMAAGGLGVAIGFSTFVFSFVNAEALRPLGVESPSSLYRMTQSSLGGSRQTWSYDEYARLREGAVGIKLGASTRGTMALGPPLEGGEEEWVEVALVSEGFLELMGAETARGRLLGPADYEASSARAVTLSYSFWRRRFGEMDDIIGATIYLDGQAYTVVGVARESFRGPTASAPAFWAPLRANEASSGGLGPEASKSAAQVAIYCRVSSDGDVRQAQAALLALGQAVLGETGGAEVPEPRLLPADMRAYGAGAADVNRLLGLASIIVVVVTAAACANLAGVLLANSVARRQEIGIRLALGASRLRVARQLVTESSLIGALGGAIGFVLALWAVGVASALLPSSAADPSPDIGVYSFVALISILSGILAGIVPATYGVRGDIRSPLAGSSGLGASWGRPSRVRSMLVGTQAFASTAVLIAAFLFTSAATRLARFDYGIDVDDLVTVSADLPRSGYDSAAAEQYWKVAVDEARRISGVEEVAVAFSPPFSSSQYYGIVRQGGADRSIYFNFTSEDWFGAAGVRVVRGRTYTDEEIATGAPVAVVSESVARDFWADLDPINQTLGNWRGALHDRFGSNLEDRLGVPLEQVTVIGVVSDVTASLSYWELNTRTVYFPLSASRALNADLLVRVAKGESAAVAAVRQVVGRIDPDVSVTAERVKEDFNRYFGLSVLYASLASATGGIALVLAMTGVLGLAAFIVQRRTPEIGVRIAVGATLRNVIALLVRDSVRPAVLGCALGVAAACAGGLALSGRFYGQSLLAPVPIFAGVVVVMAAALGAAIVPARRIASIDPAEALRRE